MRSIPGKPRKLRGRAANVANVKTLKRVGRKTRAKSRFRVLGHYGKKTLESKS